MTDDVINCNGTTMEARISLASLTVENPSLLYLGGDSDANSPECQVVVTDGFVIFNLALDQCSPTFNVRCFQYSCYRYSSQSCQMNIALARIHIFEAP